MMKSEFVLCIDSKSFHRVHYTDWGDAANPRVVICAHGLTRNGRDFDSLARTLERDFRVVCPDMAGRGQSDWLESKQDYGNAQYLADLTTLIGRVTSGGAKTVSWVGTSMGGILGILLASRVQSPIARLVVNDAGMLVPKTALQRIASYVGKDPRFRTFADLEAYVREVSAPFGPLTDPQWHHLTLHGAKQHEDGSWGMCYDPGIGIPFHGGSLADVDLADYWDAIRCPTLLLRGAQSDLLRRDTALAMTQRGPKPRLIEFEGIGHAPMLMADDQIQAVREFLLGG